jgi:hypothetical protein
MAEHTDSVLAAFGTRIGHLMRFTRILICILIAMALALLMWLVLAEVFGDGVADPDPGVYPFVAVIFGTVIYAAAWWAIVGFTSGEAAKEWRAGAPAGIIVLAGLAAVVLDVVFIILLLNG